MRLFEIGTLRRRYPHPWSPRLDRIDSSFFRLFSSISIQGGSSGSFEDPLILSHSLPTSSKKFRQYNCSSNIAGRLLCLHIQLAFTGASIASISLCYFDQILWISIVPALQLYSISQEPIQLRNSYESIPNSFNIHLPSIIN